MDAPEKISKTLEKYLYRTSPHSSKHTGTKKKYDFKKVKKNRKIAEKSRRINQR